MGSPTQILVFTIPAIGLLGLIHFAPQPGEDLPDLSPTAAVTRPSLPSPPPPETIILSEDEATLAVYHAKRDAKAFVHLYNSAVRLGATNLAGISDPADALDRLSSGVPGSGELVFKFRPKSQFSPGALLRFVRQDGTSLSLTPDAQFSPLEAEIDRRSKSCEKGACGNCVKGGRLRISQTSPGSQK